MAALGVVAADVHGHRGEAHEHDEHRGDDDDRLAALVRVRVGHAASLFGRHEARRVYERRAADWRTSGEAGRTNQTGQWSCLSAGRPIAPAADGGRALGYARACPSPPGAGSTRRWGKVMLGRRRLWAFWLAAAVLAGSCTPTTGGERASSAAPSETPVRGGTIVIGTTTSPRTLQPVLSTDTASSSVWGELYLGLTRTNRETGETEPFLAQKFEVSADGKTVIYTLREGLVWSDGTPFTGDDYKYTVEAVMRSPKTVRKSQVDLITGAKDYGAGKTDSISGIQVSGKTITIKLDRTFCPAIAALGGAGAGGILPSAKFKTVWDNKTTDVSKNIDDNPLNMAPPASMGPFVFKELRPGVQATLTRNEKYFLGAPNVDEYIVKIYADATAVKNALATGEVTYGRVEAKDFRRAHE